MRRFDKQKVLLKEVLSEVYSALSESCRKELKEEMKKEKDEQISSSRCIKSRLSLFISEAVDRVEANMLSCVMGLTN